VADDTTDILRYKMYNSYLKFFTLGPLRILHFQTSLSVTLGLKTLDLKWTFK